MSFAEGGEIPERTSGEEGERRPSVPRKLLGGDDTEIAQKVTAQQERMGRGQQEALRATASLALLDDLHESGSLKLSEVAVETLARKLQAPSQAARPLAESGIRKAARMAGRGGFTAKASVFGSLRIWTSGSSYSVVLLGVYLTQILVNTGEVVQWRLALRSVSGRSSLGLGDKR